MRSTSWTPVAGAPPSARTWRTARRSRPTRWCRAAWRAPGPRHQRGASARAGHRHAEGARTSTTCGRPSPARRCRASAAWRCAGGSPPTGGGQPARDPRRRGRGAALPRPASRRWPSAALLFANPAHERAVGALLARRAARRPVTLSCERRAGVPRVRAADTTAQRGPAARCRRVRRAARRRARASGHRAPAAPHAVQRRRRPRRARGPSCRWRSSPPARGRRGRRRPAGRRGAPRRADLRHGRHDHRRRASWSAAGRACVSPASCRLRSTCRRSTSSRSARAAARSPRGPLRRLRVGPGSAGASPGPAAYGRAARTPTVTDAHAVLGTLDPARCSPAAWPLDPPPPAAPRARASRAARARRRGGGGGRDPRRRTRHGRRPAARLRRPRPRPAPLRAGRLRGCRADARLRDRRGARRLADRRAAVPGRHVGTRASSYRTSVTILRSRGFAGPTVSDRVSSRLASRSSRAVAESCWPEQASPTGAHGSTSNSTCATAGRPTSSPSPCVGGRSPATRSGQPNGAFHPAHRRAYTDTSVQWHETEIVTLRVRATGAARVRPRAWDTADAAATRLGSRLVYTAQRGRERHAVHERGQLRAAAIDGPAIVEQDDSTSIVPRRWRLVVGAAGNVLLERSRRGT